MDEKQPVASKSKRSFGDVLDQVRDYVRIASIVLKMTEEERCDFFDWWHHERHIEKNMAMAARRGFRDFARRVGVIE